ncbi:MAG: CGLD27 family protein [Microcoleaceae cyanobacterium MO_207.B10]|nr:CGLD27 family protein [Microcoleaceae cyanobacterium MO_207.B10]
MIGQTASLSPVPPEQQPANEYQELKDSWFFCWVTLERPKYLAKLAWVWVWSWLISGPVAAVSFPPEKYSFQFLLGGAAGASLILSLVLLRLYLGWNYVRSRLANKTVFYEESGWYDGQTWLKTPEEIAKDSLIVNYQVKPLLQRLHKTFYVFLLLIISGGIIWYLL